MHNTSKTVDGDEDELDDVTIEETDSKCIPNGIRDGDGRRYIVPNKLLERSLTPDNLDFS